MGELTARRCSGRCAYIRHRVELPLVLLGLAVRSTSSAVLAVTVPDLGPREAGGVRTKPRPRPKPCEHASTVYSRRVRRHVRHELASHLHEQVLDTVAALGAGLVEGDV